MPGTLFHFHPLECAAFLRHLVDEAACFCIHFGPPLIAAGQDLRAFLHFSFATVSFGTVLCHTRILYRRNWQGSVIHPVRNRALWPLGRAISNGVKPDLFFIFVSFPGNVPKTYFFLSIAKSLRIPSAIYFFISAWYGMSIALARSLTL